MERDQTVQEGHRTPPLSRFARCDSLDQLTPHTHTSPPSPFSLFPCAGYPQPVRARLEDFQVKQNLQMARICDIQGTKFAAECKYFTVNIPPFSLETQLSLFSPSLFSSSSPLLFLLPYLPPPSSPLPFSSSSCPIPPFSPPPSSLPPPALSLQTLMWRCCMSLLRQWKMRFKSTMAACWPWDREEREQWRGCTLSLQNKQGHSLDIVWLSPLCCCTAQGLWNVSDTSQLAGRHTSCQGWSHKMTLPWLTSWVGGCCSAELASFYCGLWY